MLTLKLIGIVAILLACWQFYAVRKSFLNLKNNANQGTSVFIGFALWSGLFFGIILLVVGLGALFSWF